MYTGEQSNGLLAKMTFLDIFGFITINAVFCVKLLLTPLRAVKYKVIHGGNPVVFTLLRNLAFQESKF